ncbi:hypothetical protein DFH06DRAFT_1045945 [Mycena polygramma]|nr:hypothetical protein DFH06DRAFT_1045945 [Mycena polygramma]
MDIDASAELVRSSDFWFEDGTVILRVENTLYRVYRGVLASRSTVFRDTFSIPQPAEGGEYIEGCPVVQLHDKEKDFTTFLKALHHHGSHETCCVAGIRPLTSVVRISDKYDVVDLRASMIAILSDIYPSSLPRWRERGKATPAGYRVNDLQDPIRALNIARKLDLRHLLPGIMYLVCTYMGLETILYGVPGKPSLKIDDPTDRKRCALAIPRLILERRKVQVGFLMREEENDDCDEEAECDEERLRWLAEDLDDDDDMTDCLNNNIMWDGFEVCSSCLENAQSTHRSSQRRMWGELPAIFGLGTWAALQKPS